MHRVLTIPLTFLGHLSQPDYQRDVMMLERRQKVHRPFRRAVYLSRVLDRFKRAVAAIEHAQHVPASGQGYMPYGGGPMCLVRVVA